jgi:dTDP-4-amino-4,6-dideoxygalactose transaminase
MLIGAGVVPSAQIVLVSASDTSDPEEAESPVMAADYGCHRSHPRVVATPVPEAELVAREVLSLPAHPALSANDVERVVEVLPSAPGE